MRRHWMDVVAELDARYHATKHLIKAEHTEAAPRPPPQESAPGPMGWQFKQLLRQWTSVPRTTCPCGAPLPPRPPGRGASPTWCKRHGGSQGQTRERLSALVRGLGLALDETPPLRRAE